MNIRTNKQTVIQTLKLNRQLRILIDLHREHSSLGQIGLYHWSLGSSVSSFQISPRTENPRNNTSKKALTCATIEPASPTLAGNTTVLFVLARLENAFTYCSATLSVAALSPN